MFMTEESEKIDARLKNGDITERQAELLRMDLPENRYGGDASKSGKSKRMKVYLIPLVLLTAIGFSAYKSGLFQSRVPEKASVPKSDLPLAEKSTTPLENADDPVDQPIEVEERSAAALRETIEKYNPALKHIYNTYLLTRPGMAGTVTLKITIKSDGTVRKVSTVPLVFSE
jgi:hypothetical protein